jgi:hypothetical protein
MFLAQFFTLSLVPLGKIKVLLNSCHIVSFFPLGTVSQSGIVGSKTIFVLIIERIAFQKFANTSGGSMGSTTALTTLTIHWPLGYWFLPCWPLFLLFWLPEVVVWGSGLELSLSSSFSSIGLGGQRQRLLLVGASYMDHTIRQVISHSLWKCILNAQL